MVTWLDQPNQILSASTGFLGSSVAATATRTPSDHPEDYLEGFGNLYMNIINHIRSIKAGTTPNPLDKVYPTIEDGLASMAFIEAVEASFAYNTAWNPLDYTPTTRAKYGDASLNSDRGGLS